MLTQRDLDEIEKVVEEKIEEKTRNLPSKDEFFTAIDEVMDELKTIRENQEVLTNRVYEDHESRIKRLEKRLQISSSNL